MKLIIGILLVCISIANALKAAANLNTNKSIRSPSETSLDHISSSIRCQKCEPLAIDRSRRLRLKDMNSIEALTDSFIGGTVGVMSVAFLLEVRKVADERLDGCPYCMGNGEILCGSCFGTGADPKFGCRSCGGRGLIQCINCKGDGRITPILLQSKSVRDPDYASDNLGSGINGA